MTEKYFLRFKADDYIGAGLHYFPLNWSTRKTTAVLLVLSVILLGISNAIYFTGNFSRYYLVFVNILGLVLIYTSGRLVISGTNAVSWRLYKLSAFPYLGILFLGMCLVV